MPLGRDLAIETLVGDDDGGGGGERLLRERGGRGVSRAELPVVFPVAPLVLLSAVEDDFATRTPRQLVSLVADRADRLCTRPCTVAECLRTTDYRSGHVSAFTRTPPRRLPTTFLRRGNRRKSRAPPVCYALHELSLVIATERTESHFPTL